MSNAGHGEEPVDADVAPTDTSINMGVTHPLRLF